MEAISIWVSENGVNWGVKIAIAIVICIAGRFFARIITNLIQRVLRKGGTDGILIKFIGNIAYTALMAVVLIAALDQLGINTTSLVAIFAAAGLAVSLALKDLLSNFSAGVVMIIFRPFDIGHFITAGGVSGVVDEIGLFATMMHTADNQRVIVPNSAIIGGKIINVSALPTRRIDLVFSIGYDDNIGEARNIIMSVLEADDRILKDPEPKVAVGELADSSINLNVRPWVNSDNYWLVHADLLEKIKIKFDEANISIPYPQRDVYIHAVKTN
jgi:small conductance mechanosensitive channel